MRVGPALLCLLVAARASAAFGADAESDAGGPCSDDKAELIELLQLTIEKPRAAWKAALEEVQACGAGDERYQEAVDTAAVYLMDVARQLRVPPASDLPQAHWDFISEILLINARAGYPSSQHNYAVIHNADPADAMMGRHVEQNYDTFMEWSCRAAAQREPRAIFNLGDALLGTGRVQVPQAERSSSRVSPNHAGDHRHGSIRPADKPPTIAGERMKR